MSLTVCYIQLLQSSAEARMLKLECLHSMFIKAEIGLGEKIILLFYLVVLSRLR